MLHVEYEFRKGILFIRLYGELTRFTGLILKKELDDILKNSGILNITINLKEVIRIDGFGIKILYKYFLKIKEEGNFVICNSDSEIVRGLIKENYLLKEVSMIENEVEAFHLIKI